MKKIRKFFEWVLITLMITVLVTGGFVFALYGLYFLAGYIGTLIVDPGIA